MKKKVIFIVVILMLVIGIIFAGVMAFKSFKTPKEAGFQMPEILRTTHVQEIPAETISSNLRLYLDNYEDTGYLYFEESANLTEEEEAAIEAKYKEEFTDDEGVLDESAYEQALKSNKDNKKGVLIIKDKVPYKYDELIKGVVTAKTEEEISKDAEQDKIEFEANDVPKDAVIKDINEDGEEIIDEEGENVVVQDEESNDANTEENEIEVEAPKKEEETKDTEVTNLTPEEIVEENIEKYIKRDEEGNPILDKNGQPIIDTQKLVGWDENGANNLVFRAVEDDQTYISMNEYYYSVFEIRGSEMLTELENNNVNIVWRGTDVSNINKIPIYTSLEPDQTITSAEFRRIVTDEGDTATVIFENEEGRFEVFANDKFISKLSEYRIRTNFDVTYNSNNEITDLRYKEPPTNINGEIAEVIGLDPNNPKIRIKEGGKEYLLLYPSLEEQVLDFELAVGDLIEVKYKDVEKEDLDEGQIEVVVGDNTERKLLLAIDVFSIDKDDAKKIEYKTLELDEVSDLDEKALEKLTSNRGYYVSTSSNDTILISTEKGKAVKIQSATMKSGKLVINILEEATSDNKNYVILELSNIGIDIDDRNNIKILDSNNKPLKQMILKTFED